MRSASTRLPPPNKIIPIVAESLYKSLEYSIKRLIALRTRATFSEVTNAILQLKNRKTLGDFKIQANKLNRKKVSQVLQCLCRENKVIRKRRYFEQPAALRTKEREVARLKTVSILMVELEETGG